MLEEKYYTVSEITALIADLIEGEFLQVSVRGEISNLDRSQRGHYYFTLKDKDAQLKALLFKGKAKYYKHFLEEGVEVICTGSISVYAPKGEYRLVVDYMEKVGWGKLYQEFIRLKTLLEAEGLFDDKYKVALPLLPRKIGVVTSPEGAAIRDIIRIIRDSGYNFHLIIYPCHVQGKDAAREIVEGIRFFNENPIVDVVILARGGGSPEDLWAFNEEIVAREIFRSSVPIISAVGHERDWLISDFVADYRCATPTHAAKLLVDKEKVIRDRLDNARMIFNKVIQNKLSHCKKDLEILKKRLQLRDPRRVVSESMVRLDELTSRMRLALNNNLERKRRSLEHYERLLQAKNPAKAVLTYKERLLELETRLKSAVQGLFERRRSSLFLHKSRLEALSPRNVLKRGYAICYHNGKVLKKAQKVDLGDKVFVELAEGALECRVEEKRPLFRSC
ncbi:exodeoxyribonuclease VII large subunit [Thermosulfidibacter takaii ABI70S6]|uniref:Exodeoxyribonuclease 7 large subunit n=1 Tax=Thermosulfidibacter takaii (strain DSM 17441 / JCM 13301 / NBRC 103674 / ABI70S6) TaxID=1298851 RepID=A0A0S3QT46_THET7|nr:exodeoxyribonuclease VII large subunit [Thermosulfidibacter takaii]BAT71510.1 exodeoxyribonuclease VII large subunit [Thermosulfidibacter takaii ABI70S6]